MKKERMGGNQIFGIVSLYQGTSGKRGYYNSQEIGLARAMARKGYKSVVFYPESDRKEIGEENIERNVIIVKCPARHMGVHSVYNWEILLQYEIKTALIAGDNQFFAPSLLKFCKKNNIKAACYIGTVQSDTSNKIKQLIMIILAYRNVLEYRKHKCFAKTEDICKLLERNRVRDVEILPVGLDLSIIPKIEDNSDKIRERYGIEKEFCVVLFVGRIDKYKKPLEAIKVFEQIDNAGNASGNTYRFYVIGTGKLNREFEEAIQKSSIANKLVWIKEIPNRVIHEYYKMADYLINLNDKEIFGMSILEALYQGCTVIARRASGPNFIIEDDEYGFLIEEVDDAVGIISRRLKIDSDKVKKRIMEKFSWDSSADILLKWLNK